MQPHYDIGDHNLERLLNTAYHPEPVDAAFAQRLNHRLQEEGRIMALRRTCTPLEEQRLRRVRRRMGWGMAIAASIALTLVVAYARSRNGEDGTFRASSNTLGSAAHFDFPSLSDDLAHGLRPRSLPPAPAVQPLAVGTTLTTKGGERRRVGLADGSIIYVNQNTQLRPTAARQVELVRGEIYVEVAPRPAGEDGATFVVKTPSREVSALGTRFGVQTGDDGAGVVVTQGKVQVGGVDTPLSAGQQLPPGGTQPITAPRVSQVLDWTRELMAASESPLVPCSQHAGGALLALDPNGQQVNLSLRVCHIDVHVEDGFARTTIDQTYFNNLYSRTEGTFYFPLPPDASLSRLAMYVEGSDGLCKLMEGGMAERDHARNVYETILHQRRDPALLEWVDGSTFKMRVFPLEGRKEKRIILSYTQRLPVHDGTTRYRFPAGHSLELVRDWSFSARVMNAEGLRITSTSHPDMKTIKELKNTVLSWSASGVKQDKDLTLEIRDPQAQGLKKDQVRFASFTHEKQDYLMLRYRPHLQGKPKAERRDWIVLFEASAHRDPLVARAQVEVVRKLLENAEHDDTVAVVIAGARTRVLDKDLRTLNEKNRKEAIQFLESAHLVGALDLGSALDALAPFWKDANNPHIVHVGAGVPAMGETQLDALVKKIPEDVRYVGVGVGKRWNRAFMKQAAERTGGLFTQINPDEPIGWRAFDLLATLNTPRLLSLRVLDHAEKVTFLTDAALLSQGEELCAFARYQGERPEKVIVTGREGGKQFTRVLPVDNVQGGAGYLPRTWAKLEIDRLLADGADKHKDAITTLSKASYVMSPFTSLLVLETDADYEKYKIDRGRKDHWAMYPCPDRIPIVYDAGHQPAPEPKQEVKGTKPTPEQVLDTILVRMSPQVVARPGENVVQAGPAYTAKALYQRVVGLPLGDDYGLHQWNDSWGAIPSKDKQRVLAGLSKDLAPRHREAVDIYMRQLGGERSLKIAEDRKELRDLIMMDGLQPRFAKVPPPLFLDVFGRPVRTLYLDEHYAKAYTLDLGMKGSNFEVDWREYYRNHGYQVNVKGKINLNTVWSGDFDTNARIKFAPVFVSPTVKGAVPNEALAQLGFRPPFPKRQTPPPLPGGGDMMGGGMMGGGGGMVGMGGGMMGMGGGMMGGGMMGGGMMGGGMMGGGGHHRIQFAPVFVSPTMQWAVPNGALSGHPAFALPPKGVFRTWSDDYANMNSIEFFPPNLAVVLRGSDRMSTSITGGIIGSKATRKQAAAREAELRGLSVVSIKHIDHLALYDALAAIKALEARLEKPFVYQRPTFVPDQRFFGDLTLYAPGLTTSMTDINVVLEQETERPALPTGKIDNAARTLIDRARAGGWQAIEVPAHNREPAYKVYFNGAGQFAYERILSSGLREQVVCDGTDLHHLYPEIGLASRRPCHRAYQHMITDLAPWLVPSVDELARGADVKLLNATTVALIPHQPAAQASEPRLEAHLVFAADGRLAERRLVVMPKQDVLVRVAYDGQGSIKLLDNKDQAIIENQVKVAKAEAPNLRPDLKDLVVVPLPIRTQAKVLPPGKVRYDDLPEGETVALLYEAVSNGNFGYAMQIYGYRFAKDQRPGFLTLLTAAGGKLKFNETMDVNGVKVTLDLSEPRFQTPLGKYLVHHHRGIETKEPPLMELLTGAGFIEHFARFRNLYTLYTTRKVRSENGYDIVAEWKKVREFLRETPSPLLAFAVQDALYKDGELVNNETYALLAKAFPDAGLFTSVFRYENGRGQVGTASGSKTEAVRVYTDYYLDALKAGVVPPIEDRFVEAMGKDGGFANFMRKHHVAALKNDQPGLALMLAEQCQEVHQQALADELYLATWRAADKDDRLWVGLATVAHLEETKQLAPAETMLREILTNADAAKLSGLWRKAATLAQQRNLVARAAAAMDQALDLEFRELPEVVNLEAFRPEYRALLTQYQQLASALAALEKEAPKDFIAKVIRAADRWRSLDPDNAEPCNLAAKILQTVGARELAWDYLTTPIGSKPNESAPWLNLANNLRQEADYALADLAYAQAFQAEATNPQILWDRAVNLQSLGKSDDVRRLYRQIAEGAWQERFNNVKQQAQGQLQR